MIVKVLELTPLNIAKKFPRKITDTFILRPVPLLCAGLAGQHWGPAGVLPRHAARDRTRHHLLLGRQDGLLRAEAHGQAPLQGCLPTRHGEREVEKLTPLYQLFIFLGRCEFHSWQKTNGVIRLLIEDWSCEHETITFTCIFSYLYCLYLTWWKREKKSSLISLYGVLYI